MYKAGHYGTALIVYAPLAFIFAYLQYYPHLFIAGFIIVGFTRVPDWDISLSFVTHRGITHTFLFAGLTGLFTGGLVAGGFHLLGDITAYWLHMTATTERLLQAFGFGFAMGALSILAHLLGDIITPTGIRPFLPFKRSKYSLNLTTAASPVANPLLFAIGVGLTLGALLIGIYMSGVIPAEGLSGIDIPIPGPSGGFEPAP